MRSLSAIQVKSATPPVTSRIPPSSRNPYWTAGFTFKKLHVAVPARLPTVATLLLRFSRINNKMRFNALFFSSHHQYRCPFTGEQDMFLKWLAHHSIG